MRGDAETGLFLVLGNYLSVPHYYTTFPFPYPTATLHYCTVTLHHPTATPTFVDVLDTYCRCSIFVIQYIRHAVWSSHVLREIQVHVRTYLHYGVMYTFTSKFDIAIVIQEKILGLYKKSNK